jgi:hypothetical protein
VTFEHRHVTAMKASVSILVIAGSAGVLLAAVLLILRLFDLQIR